MPSYILYYENNTIVPRINAENELIGYIARDIIAATVLHSLLAILETEKHTTPYATHIIIHIGIMFIELTFFATARLPPDDCECVGDLVTQVIQLALLPLRSMHSKRILLTTQSRT